MFPYRSAPNKDVGSIIKVGGAHRLRGTMAGSLEVTLSTWSGGLDNANQLGKSGGMLPWEILRLGSSELCPSL